MTNFNTEFENFHTRFEQTQTIITIGLCVIFIGFIVFFAVVIYNLIKSKKQNLKAPVLTTDATVVAKRSDVKIHRHHSRNTMDYTTSSTTYHVTFQVPSGDRMELVTQDYEYGLLVENDTGKLTFQGNRFLKFERNRAH